MNKFVILSEAKDHLATLDPLKKILRFAQDDTEALLAMTFCHSPGPVTAYSWTG